MDAGYYLPPFKCVNIYFMKALMGRKKRALKNSEVRHLSVPQYDTLSISKLLDFMAAYAAVEDFLPEARDISMLPRQWLINVGFAIIG